MSHNEDVPADVIVVRKIYRLRNFKVKMTDVNKFNQTLKSVSWTSLNYAYINKIHDLQQVMPVKIK